MFRRLRTPAAALLIAGLLVGACGDDDDSPSSEPESPLGDPALTEAAPGAEPEAEGVEAPGELEASDRQQVEAAVRAYVAALNQRDAAAVCAAISPAAVSPRDFPVEIAVTATGSQAQQRARFCRGAVGATIGRPPRGGGPAWRRTRVNALESVSVGEKSARVTATVTHAYAGGDPGIGLEEDVIYLVETAGGWLVAKPSGTFFRAVGFATPPLRALTPP